MSLIHSYLFPGMWLAYIGYWWGIAAKAKSTVRRESTSSRLARFASFACAVALLGLPSIPLPFVDRRILPQVALCFWFGFGVTAVGMLFSIWARRHLGSNWSQAVTIREGHELITSGPYAMVRHPIYTGLLAALLGCAIARDEWRGLLAMALVLATLWHKLRLEEQWMRERFGESYEAYRRRVAALLPYVI